MPLSNVTKYNYSKADYAKIIECLKEIDWKLKFQDLDAEKMWNIFCDILNGLVNVTRVVTLCSSTKLTRVFKTMKTTTIVNKWATHVAHLLTIISFRSVG